MKTQAKPTALLFQTLKFILPVGLGVYLVISIYNSLTPHERDTLFSAFKQADYTWFGVSVMLGLASHLSRAWRWRYLLEAVGHRIHLMNAFGAVMAGYLVNMVLPRAGEASRAAVATQYEKVPFERSFGTILAERTIDLVMLALITGATLFLQFGLLKETYYTLRDAVLGLFTPLNLLLGAMGSIAVTIGLWWLFRRSREKAWVIWLRNLVAGLTDGLRSIFTMKKKWLFLLHTVLIWTLYVGMFWVCFFSLPSTSNLPVGAIFGAFVAGSFSLILVPGGIGAFPAALMQTLVLYGLSREWGFALGWITWAAQTSVMLGVGAMSLVILPIYNRKFNSAQP